jgi:hypothetical protein
MDIKVTRKRSLGRALNKGHQRMLKEFFFNSNNKG